MLLSFLELHTFDTLEKDLIPVFKFMLLILEQLYDTLFGIRDSFDHDILEIFPVLVEHFELLAKVVEDSRKDTLAACADELDSLLAAVLVHNVLCDVVRIGHDYHVVLVQIPRFGLKQLLVVRNLEVCGLLAPDVEIELL